MVSTNKEFLNPDVIFDFSDYSLNDLGSFFLSLGLRFNLPTFKPSFSEFFLPFEIIIKELKSFYQTRTTDFENARKLIQGFAHITYERSKKKSYCSPFFKKSDVELLKSLGNNKNLVVCKPDKGNGVVLSNRHDYDGKIMDSDNFLQVSKTPYRIVIKLEDKINRFLRYPLNIDDNTYKNLYSSDGFLCTLYGMPKIHKDEIPLRPILATFNFLNNKLPKYLVSFLSFLTMNQYFLKKFL